MLITSQQSCFFKNSEIELPYNPAILLLRIGKSISRLGCLGLGEMEQNGEWLLMDMGFFLESWKCSKIDCGDGCIILWKYQRPMSHTL